MNTTMVIETWFFKDGQPELLREPYRYERGGGYDSPADYVREGLRKWADRNARPYKNGLQMDGYAGTIQRVWFELEKGQTV